MLLTVTDESVETDRWKWSVSCALLRLISVTISNFTHPPVLSALLPILSAFRSLVPDLLLSVPVSILSSVPLHGKTFPVLSGHLQIQPQNISFSKTIDPLCFPLSHYCLPPSKAPFYNLSLSLILCTVYLCERVPVGMLECVCAFRMVLLDHSKT